jgi:peptidoglycan hydrolase CwlO-like protein
MTDEQPLALMLADRIATPLAVPCDLHDAAAELRRQHDENEALMARVAELKKAMESQKDEWLSWHEKRQRLANIEAAARNLVKVKGRYHTEHAFKALAEVLGNTGEQR